MNAELSSRKRSAMVAREPAKFLLFTRPVARPLLQEVDEGIAPSEAPVERMDYLQGRTIIRRRRGRSVVWRGPDSLPNLTQLCGRELSKLFNQALGGRSHGLTLSPPRLRAKRTLFGHAFVSRGRFHDWMSARRFPRPVRRQISFDVDLAVLTPHPGPLPVEGRGGRVGATRTPNAAPPRSIPWPALHCFDPPRTCERGGDRPMIQAARSRLPLPSTGRGPG